MLRSERVARDLAAGREVADADALMTRSVRAYASGTGIFRRIRIRSAPELASKSGARSGAAADRLRYLFVARFLLDSLAAVFGSAPIQFSALTLFSLIPLSLGSRAPPIPLAAEALMHLIADAAHRRWISGAASLLAMLSCARAGIG